MARLAKNSIAYGLRGTIGELVFKTYNGETYLSGKPTFPKKRKLSALQEANCNKFKEAQAYAGQAMRSPEKKAYYLKKAKELKLSNARTAAVTEYMRRPKVEKVDTRKFTGTAGDRIAVIARKKDFNNIDAVEIILYNAEGQIIEKGNASKTSTVNWIYTATITDNRYKKITISVKDRTGQVTTTDVNELHTSH